MMTLRTENAKGFMADIPVAVGVGAEVTIRFGRTWRAVDGGKPENEFWAYASGPDGAVWRHYNRFASFEQAEAFVNKINAMEAVAPVRLVAHYWDVWAPAKVAIKPRSRDGWDVWTEKMDHLFGDAIREKP